MDEDSNSSQSQDDQETAQNLTTSANAVHYQQGIVGNWQQNTSQLKNYALKFPTCHLA